MLESVKRSDKTISPLASAGRISSSTFCARQANMSSSSEVAVSSWLAASSRMRRICWPMRPPPGSAVSKTARPWRRRRSASRRNCVDLPLPSKPSNVMNRPRRRLVIDIVQDLLQVFPRLPFCGLIILPQQVGRMIRHHDRNVAPLLPVAAQPHDSLLGSEQSLCGRPAQRANGFGPDRQELAEQKLAADLHLIGLRRAVAGRTALDDIADINVFAAQRNPFLLRRVLDHLREKLPGAPYKRNALLVFIGPRAFADKNERRALVPNAKYNLGSALVETAAAAIADVFENLEHGIAGRDQRRQLGLGLGRLWSVFSNVL